MRNYYRIMLGRGSKHADDCYKVDIWPSKVADYYLGGSGESNPLTIIYN